MKSRTVKKQSVKEGIIFVSLFFVTALAIGIYKVIFANQLVTVEPSSVPTATAEQRQPYYSAFISSVDTASVDEANQTKQIRVKVTINNPSTKPMQIAPGLQMLLVDANGVGYPMTAKYLSVGKIVGGELKPKETKTYSVDFELPFGSQPKTFNFQLDASYKPTELAI